MLGEIEEALVVIELGESAAREMVVSSESAAPSPGPVLAKFDRPAKQAGGPFLKCAAMAIVVGHFRSPQPGKAVGVILDALAEFRQFAIGQLSRAHAISPIRVGFVDIGPICGFDLHAAA